MKRFPEYKGLGYDDASREAQRLIREAALSGRWLSLPDRLKHLREILKESVR